MSGIAKQHFLRLYALHHEAKKRLDTKGGKQAFVALSLQLHAVKNNVPKSWWRMARRAAATKRTEELALAYAAAHPDMPATLTSVDGPLATFTTARGHVLQTHIEAFTVPICIGDAEFRNIPLARAAELIDQLYP